VVPPEEAFQVVLEVTRLLDSLRVPYLVGGSLASSLHGIPRATQDADLLANLRIEHVHPFVGAVSLSFYVEAERVTHAVQRRSSFNLVHLKTAIKVDIFVLKPDPMSLQEMARRQILSVPGEPGTVLQVATAEDTVLQKLLWYQNGNCISERQWNDVLGVLKVQRQRLDLDYLKKWAPRIGVDDLLRQAFEDSGITTTA
jgi:hypothetical protein